jgi:hypothetical protein
MNLYLLPFMKVDLQAGAKLNAASSTSKLPSFGRSAGSYAIMETTAPHHTRLPRVICHVIEELRPKPLWQRSAYAFDRDNPDSGPLPSIPQPQSRC